MSKCLFLRKVITFISISLFIYLLSRYNYLLFHSMTEVFSICIAFSVFLVTVNSSKYMKESYLFVIGYAYLFIGILDFFHTITFTGMNVIEGYDFYANQIWVGARYFESVVLLISTILVGKSLKIKPNVLILSYMFITFVLIYSIIYSDLFPVCFIPGSGQTSFKIISEVLIIFVLIAALSILKIKKDNFKKLVYRNLTMSIVLTVMSELMFTLYTDNYGITNALGHIFKVMSFYMIYRAIVMTGIKEPYLIIFKELSDAREQLLFQNQYLKNMVHYDGLTGVHNKRYILDRLEDEIERYKRYREPFVLMMIDVDNFKVINDTYGHTVGDEVLKEMSSVLVKSARASDIVGRYGGDEFVMILIEAKKEHGLAIAEKVLKHIDEAVFSEDVHITVSIGIACYREGDVEAFINEADKGLYYAKRDGKNKIIGVCDINERPSS